MTTPYIITHLAAADLPLAGAVLDAAFERTGMAARLRLPYALQPDSWFCARGGDEVVGVVGAHAYDAHAYGAYDYGAPDRPAFASIGMMAVAPSAQRQGLGEALMAALIEYLEGRGCPVQILDASEAGQPLYPRLGFAAEGETLRMVRKSGGRSGDGQARPREDYGVVVTVMEERDLETVAAFDAPYFGAHRGVILGVYLAGSPDSAFVARDRAGRVTGYLMAGGEHIGPWTAATPLAAAALLSAALALPFERAPFLTCPSDNEAALELLARHGFTVTERLLHMRRGGTRDPRRPAHIYSQASLTLG